MHSEGIRIDSIYGSHPVGTNEAIFMFAPAEARDTLATPQGQAALRHLTDWRADQRRLIPHHADWLLTDDIEEVRAFGTVEGHADCPGCLMALQEAEMMLGAHADSLVLIGRIYWVGNPSVN